VEKLDIRGAASIVNGIRTSRIRTRVLDRSKEDGPTSCGRRILERYAVLPELGFGTSRDEAEKIRNRLLRRQIDLRCFECGRGGRRRIADLQQPLACPHCGSRFMTIPSGAAERLVLELRTAGEKMPNRDVLSRLKWKADLLAIYGSKAAMALSVRGIGPQTASRILSRMYEDEDEFVTDLIRASGRYEATRQYWAS
jgi:ATP-dependent Lhr-like helicase